MLLISTATRRTTFNGDSTNDLLVASPVTIAVLAGDGAGNFAAPVTTPATQGKVAGVADFNADGKLDLYLAGTDPVRIRVLTGIGDGRFQAHAELAANSVAATVAADIDNDNDVDLVSISRPCSSRRSGTAA